MKTPTPSKSQKQLIVFPKGSLDSKTKELLSKNGYFGIEVDDPKAVVTILPLAQLTAPLNGDEIVRAMAAALASHTYAANKFGELLSKTIAAKVQT